MDKQHPFEFGQRVNIKACGTSIQGEVVGLWYQCDNYRVEVRSVDSQGRIARDWIEPDNIEPVVGG